MRVELLRTSKNLFKNSFRAKLHDVFLKNINNIRSNKLIRRIIGWALLALIVAGVFIFLPF